MELESRKKNKEGASIINRKTRGNDKRQGNLSKDSQK
jgi:hypothetical protein